MMDLTSIDAGDATTITIILGWLSRETSLWYKRRKDRKLVPITDNQHTLPPLGITNTTGGNGNGSALLEAATKNFAQQTEAWSKMLNESEARWKKMLEVVERRAKDAEIRAASAEKSADTANRRADELQARVLVLEERLLNLGETL